MAPHSAHAAAPSSLHLLGFSDKYKLKMRKPIIEKMRRDRINGCIDQLKKLLEKQLHSQDPSVKLEKADVLEMTVSFLKQQQGPPTAPAWRDYDEGYSQCWRTSLQFLDVHSNKVPSTQGSQQGQQAQTGSRELCCNLPSPKRGPSTRPQASDPLWRPW
ncbi:hairy-related 12 [Brachyhypopomus gauderio]|uniref:hairy-related 12 n=1 Tax=Brachyhypopomus gauderio TaxID=698409 RepID=UPI0040414DC7